MSILEDDPDFAHGVHMACEIHPCTVSKKKTLYSSKEHTGVEHHDLWIMALKQNYDLNHQFLCFFSQSSQLIHLHILLYRHFQGILLSIGGSISSALIDGVETSKNILH